MSTRSDIPLDSQRAVGVGAWLSQPANRHSLLFLRYGSIIYARAKSILGDVRVSKRAVYEMFSRISDRLGEAADDASALRLIYREVTTLCFSDACRYVHRLKAERFPASVAIALDLGSGFPRHAIRPLIARVPEELRASVWLCYVDKIARSEVAEILQIPLSAVDLHLSEFDAWKRTWQEQLTARVANENFAG